MLTGKVYHSQLRLHQVWQTFFLIVDLSLKEKKKKIQLDQQNYTQKTEIISSSNTFILKT